MRAAVTGGTGFIGSHLVEHLARAGWALTVLTRRAWPWGPPPPGVRWVAGGLDEPAAVGAAVAGADVVFHLAWSGFHELSNLDPAADVRANLVPSVTLIEACRAAGVRRIVFTSSGGTVYGVPRELPIPEAHPLAPLSAYGINKVAVEHYLRLTQHLHGLEQVVLRPSVAYGPRQSPRRRQGAVAVFLYRVARGETVTIWGDGEIARDYFHVADLVTALSAAATVPAASGAYNIGGPAVVTLRELLAAVERTVGRTARVRYEPARAFDAPRVVLDTGRARAELGWAPVVGLADGLARTWAWLWEWTGAGAAP